MAILDGLLGVLPALHLHEGTLAELEPTLGPALGPAFAPVVVVVPVVAGSFMCRSRRRCGPCKRNLAGAGEHGAVALVALPVQLRGAEEAGLGEEEVRRVHCAAGSSPRRLGANRRPHPLLLFPTVVAHTVAVAVAVAV